MGWLWQPWALTSVPTVLALTSATLGLSGQTLNLILATNITLTAAICDANGQDVTLSLGSGTVLELTNAIVAVTGQALNVIASTVIALGAGAMIFIGKDLSGLPVDTSFVRVTCDVVRKVALKVIRVIAKPEDDQLED